MNVRINQGYVITDSIHIGKAEFVIGEMSNTPAPFVTWECKDGNNYFWGHYLTTRKAAERDLLERAVQELEYQTRRQAEMEPQDSPWGEIRMKHRVIPPGAKSRPAKPSALARIPSAQQDTAALWCVRNWRKRRSERKRGNAALWRERGSATRRIVTGR